MNPFWKNTPLTVDELELMDAVFLAHDQSASRENVSSHCFLQTAVASGSYANAVASAALTIGGLHAPIEKTAQLLKGTSPASEAVAIIKAGGRVPGWGNSFEKGHLDPLWINVDQILFKKFPEIYSKIQSVTEAIHSEGKDIYPNPSCYSAAACMALGMQDWMGAYLFIAGRLTGWCKLLLKS